jgi:hypothetical protein
MIFVTLNVILNKIIDMFRIKLYVFLRPTIGVNPGGWGRDPQDFEMGVVEDVVSGLLRSKGEGREPRTPSFQTRLTPLRPTILERQI